MTGPFTVTFAHGNKKPPARVGDGVATADLYESVVTVAGPQAGTFRGSIFPDDLTKKGRLKDGRYPLHIGFHRRDKQPTPTTADLVARLQGFRAALIVARDGPVPVVSDNPAKTTGSFIHVHNGFRETRSSDGCPTVHPPEWERFLGLFLQHYPKLEDWTATDRYIGVACGELVVQA
jgi:hypothetical protein